MRPLPPLVLPLLAPLLTLSCSGAMPPSTAAVGTPGLATNLRVGFPPRGLVDTIEIAAVERLPLRSAELIAPDGTATPASYLNVADSPSFATGQSDLGNTWRGPIDQSSQFPGLNAQNPQAGAAVFGDQQLLSMVSSAEIPLPDPVVYRREWQRYRIRLTFGTPPSPLESQQIPAPAPPPPTAAAPLGG